VSILVLVPSRGRPERAALMERELSRTQDRPDTGLLFLVDPDDPTLPDYRRNVRHLVLPGRLGYTASLNLVAAQVWDERTVLGAFGDDVIFRSPGWDTIVLATLETPGLAYGDDLIHGKNHPSAVFMSSVIAKALGWLALPATSHQWADDGWKRLGQETGLLRFMPDVIVEHMHPAVNKAEWDDTYRSVFDGDRAKSDYEGFTGWAESGGLAADAAKVQAALGAPA
jgi:hypothetical protein